MLHPGEITGAVLAGGKSSRFGANKALCNYNGNSFIGHTIELIQPYTKEVIIAGRYPEYKNLGIPVLEDKIPGIGPLGGIYTALTYSTTRWVLILTCDMPLMAGEVIMHMLAAGRGENVIGWDYNGNAGIFPLLVSKNILPELENIIGGKQYNVKQIFDRCSSLRLTIPGKWQHLFTNINNQDEYKNILT